ncbi:MAG: ABC transporter ATP-binding protein [Corynebacterium sp.]|uniref:ABC transporter ATP-binding protein n=1 Tax=Corynebacterium sp. TaxID=1720 RepID=UPI0026DB49FC|nr:ABC transporter ATP-binding protein [Corynebacterium sp.]MDO4760788.1 ABC transporter ATP-binding protein [Corynebacterium sp.]
MATHETPSGLLIEMHNIVKKFNIGTENELTVLRNCEFDVAPGEFVSVVGSSGCGKSTLMNIIGMLDRPTTGSYRLSGVDVLALRDDEAARYRSLHIGFVFQNFNLIGRISARKNVEMSMMYAGVGRKEREARADELLEMVGMADRAGHSPAELSGGQKQRVAIARALANRPDLILADEPTGALDSKTGRMVMDLFHTLNQEHGATIVFITHNPELAAETTRIVTMHDGVISGPRAPRVPQQALRLGADAAPTEVIARADTASSRGVDKHERGDQA